MKIIVANWKMNPQSAQEARSLFSAVKKNASKKTEVIVCPPFLFLPCLPAGRPALSNVKGQMFKPACRQAGVKLGAQNCFWENSGAYTGEISPFQLKNAGCEYVILGHSERRRRLSETDEMLNKKVKAALEAGLKIVFCVGEEERVGEFDLEAEIVGSQLENGLSGIPRTKMRDIIVAYEPVWAIGTGVSDTPNQTLQAAIFIRKKIGEMFGRNIGGAQKVLYGGSVTSKNVKPFIEQEGIDGVLVGGASLNGGEFLKIIDQATELE